MFVKYVGSVCILIGCAMMGIKANMRLKEHVSLLSGFISALETIESEISCRLSTVQDALRAAYCTIGEGRGKCSAFFRRCLSGFEEKGPDRFAEIWRGSVEYELSFLPEAEKQLLGELSEILGNYGAEEQAGAIGYIRRRLESFLQAAEKEKERSGKVYMTLGLTFGIAVVIVLI